MKGNLFAAYFLLRQRAGHNGQSGDFGDKHVTQVTARPVVTEV
jgi:hypothetical protein